MNSPFANAEAEVGRTHSPYAQRARYRSGENGFDFAWPEVPVRQFLAERDRAFDPASPTGLIPLDSSDVLACAYPATTPTLLCRYLRIRAGDALRTHFIAAGEIFYVMSGAGESRNAGDTVEWQAGDVFCFAGGAQTVHSAGNETCVLFGVTDEPLLAFQRMRPSAREQAVFATTHWPSEEIDRRFEAVWKRPITPQTTGTSIQLTSAELAPTYNTIPAINCSINTLAVGCDQRPHRHNGVAVTLAIQGVGIHSMIGGQRLDWSNGAAQITPATQLHSHHNRGTQRMRSFVIQDEGLHFYMRTAGFSFD